MDVDDKASEIEVEQEHVQDDDLLSSATTVSRSATPEDLVISKISRPLALSLAAVFEELADRLALVGFTLPTPAVDARTRDSLTYSLLHNLPILNETTISGEPEGWLLRQHYTSHIPRRLDYIVEPALEARLSASDIDATFDSLIQQIAVENKEQADKEEQYKKVNMYKQYIQKVKTAIKETRMHKEEQNALQKIEIHNLTDLLLEQDIRSHLEDKYIRKLGAAKVSTVRKFNMSREARRTEVYQQTGTRMQLDNIVHESMMKIIGEKLQETTVLHDNMVEKYEKDFNRMALKLEELYKCRKRDLDRIAWLKRRIVDYERIVFDDRRIKKKAEDKRQRKLNENQKAVKIQAWWRGTMVRKWLGSFLKLFSELYDYKSKKREAKAQAKGRPRPKK